MKVFGIGLNKTGTISLHEALETLGFRSLHWGGPSVRSEIERAMSEGRPMVEFLDDYDAFSDITLLSENFEALDRQYPGSKFILTTRDLPGWLESRRRHVEQNIAQRAQGRYDGIFLTVDYDEWTDRFREHHTRVLEHFASRPDDLLVMNIVDGDGYEKLCPFLGRPTPDTPFPWRNRAASCPVVDPGHELPLPSFLIIGAEKSATRWLRHNLGLHPEILTAPREVKFFNHPQRIAALGLDWYRQQFEDWAGESIVGEATPGYMMWRHDPDAVARRIKETLPDVRLIALLRNPVDRANSALVHHIQAERIHPGTTLRDFVRQQPPEQDWMGIVTGGWYATSLEPYRALFGDQLLVVLHDDVRADPQRVYDEVRRHVGASVPAFPRTLDDVLRSNQQDSSFEVAPEARREVFELFRDEVDRLERMLGRDLGMWRPD